MSEGTSFLCKLSDRLKLAAGRKYRVRRLNKDLVFDLGKGTDVHGVSDDLWNSYIRGPINKK